jgi:hypothetical protein
MIKIGEYPLKIINTLKQKPKKMILKIGEQKDWKFGLITRTCYRVNEDLYEIHDCSDGWQIARVNHKTFEKLIAGEISLLSLDWK